MRRTRARHRGRVLPARLRRRPAGEHRAGAGRLTAAASADEARAAAKVLHRQGRLPEAIAGYRQVLDLQPDDFEAAFLLAGACLKAGDAATAAAYAERAAAQNPAPADVHGLLAEAYAALGRWADALAGFDEALARKPDHAAALRGRAAALLQLRRHEEAVDAFDAALGLDARHAASQRGRGHALLALSRFEEAVGAYGAAIALRPDDAASHYNRGAALLALERPAEALESLDRAIAIDPLHAEARNNRGTALYYLGRFEEAVASFDVAIALQWPGIGFEENRRQALLLTGRVDDVLADLEGALARKPGDAILRSARGLVLLSKGRFAEGWREWEHRWDAATFTGSSAGLVTPAVRTRLARWPKAEDLAGREVLCVAEQGVGDVVMLASLLPDLKATAAGVTLACEPRLHRLFANSFPDIPLVDAAEPVLDRFETVVAMSSLAGLYRTSPEDFPGKPYLAATRGARRRWAERLGPKETRLRVGVSWRGGVKQTLRSQRSVDLAQLAPILRLPDCEFVDLQYGDHTAEVDAVNATLPRPIRRFDPGDLKDFDDLAALVQELDLVVSVQTSLVHLSGALGAPALVLLPHVPEWRYAAGGDRMLWYDSVRLFRQGPDRAWGPVIERIAAELRHRA